MTSDQQYDQIEKLALILADAGAAITRAFNSFGEKMSGVLDLMSERFNERAYPPDEPSVEDEPPEDDDYYGDLRYVNDQVNGQVGTPVDGPE